MLLDSGATNNFMLRRSAELYRLEFNTRKSITVRLADGKTVKSSAFCVASVHLGHLIIQQRFEILDADVSTILSMPFLESANPIINWKKKSVRIKHKG